MEIEERGIISNPISLRRREEVYARYRAALDAIPLPPIPFWLPPPPKVAVGVDVVCVRAGTSGLRTIVLIVVSELDCGVSLKLS